MEESLEERFDHLVNDAINEVERLARKHLQQDPKSGEFLMCMGSWFVTNSSDELAEEGTYDELKTFLDTWDDRLKLTGHAMRFTAKGKLITNW